jgi:hypothetical protein
MCVYSCAAITTIRLIHLAIGQIWRLNLRFGGYATPPHVEDTLIVGQEQEQLGVQENMRGELLKHIHPWKGGLTSLFDGCLQGDDRQSVFISQVGGVPKCSTGFWLTTLPLTLHTFDGRAYYKIDSVVHKGSLISHATYAIRYVGFAEPLLEIPQNTLVRVSLCRWWKKDERTEERCYLQISGWYI